LKLFNDSLKPVWRVLITSWRLFEGFTGVLKEKQANNEWFWAIRYKGNRKLLFWKIFLKHSSYVMRHSPWNTG